MSTTQEQVLTEEFEFKFLTKWLDNARKAITGKTSKMSIKDAKKHHGIEDFDVDGEQDGKIYGKTSRTELNNNELFKAQLDKFVQDHGVTPSEIYGIISGESSYNTKAFNRTGATGLFQFMPQVAAEHGTSANLINQMSADEQMQLWNQYATKWKKYHGIPNLKFKLGVLQAAPAHLKKDPSEVIYKKDSKAWDVNPGWREDGDGDITVASISDYYTRKA